MFDGANLALISDVEQTNRCLVRMKIPCLSMYHLLVNTYKLRYKKEMKQR